MEVDRIVPAQRVVIGDAELEVSDWGSGDPIVFVQTALIADALLPLAHQPPLADGYRKIVYYRRGYAGSRAAEKSASIVHEAEDARSLLTAMGIERTHLVGVSYSGAIALQLAADAPELVQSLILAEPPPLHTSHDAEFRSVNEELLALRRERGVDSALEHFGSRLFGDDWRRRLEDDLPGAVSQVERDAPTFFDSDIPALLGWRFGPADADRIRCPVLYIGGTDSGPWFAEVRDLVRGWLPHAEERVIQGAGHSLEITHAQEVGDALAAFLRQHPISPPRL